MIIISIEKSWNFSFVFTHSFFEWHHSVFFFVSLHFCFIFPRFRLGERQLFFLYWRNPKVSPFQPPRGHVERRLLPRGFSQRPDPGGFHYRWRLQYAETDEVPERVLNISVTDFLRAGHPVTRGSKRKIGVCHAPHAKKWAMFFVYVYIYMRQTHLWDENKLQNHFSHICTNTYTRNEFITFVNHWYFCSWLQYIFFYGMFVHDFSEKIHRFDCWWF